MNSFYAIHKLIMNEKRRINNIDVKNQIIMNKQNIENIQKKLNKFMRTQFIIRKDDKISNANKN
jgi:hypothetical protein